MSAKRVIVEVTPSRLEVCEWRAGSVGASRSERLPRGDWGGQWPAALEDLRRPLKRLVDELGCAGARATVVYSGPGSVAAVSSCPLSAGTAGAEEAARLALANLSDFPLEGNPHSMHELATDPPSPRGAGAGNPLRQMHMLAIGELEEPAGAIGALIESAGLRLEGLVPYEAAGVLEAVAMVTGTSGSESVRAVLWFGEHGSVLAASNGGRLLFARSVGAGVESLVDAMVRPIQSKSGESELVTLDRAAAREILAAIGIPAFDQEVPGFPTLRGSSLLPHLQPVLQRLAIEIKQSLRFGLGESERGQIRLAIVGPGVSLPGLPETLARQSGIQLADGGGATGLPREGAAHGAIAGLAAALPEFAGMLPAGARRSTSARRLRRALVTGVAAAACLITVEGVTTRLRLAQEESRLAQLRHRAELDLASAELRDRAVAARMALTSVERRISDTLGEVPDWSGVLASLAETTPESVRLTGIDLSAEAGTPRCQLHGYVRLRETPDAPAVIKAYVERLSSAPLVGSVKLGSTKRTPVRGLEAEVFELAVTLVPVPAHATAAGSMAAADGKTAGVTP